MSGVKKVHNMCLRFQPLKSIVSQHEKNQKNESGTATYPEGASARGVNVIMTL